MVFLGEQPWEVDLAHWRREQPIITVHPQPLLASKAIRSDAAAALDFLGTYEWSEDGVQRRQPWVGGWRRLEQLLSAAPSTTRADGIDLAHAMFAISARLDDDAIICLDAGNFGSWVHRYVALREGQRLLAVADGSMGSAVPAAMALANRFTDRQVVAIVGDGGVMMTGNELLMGPSAWRRPAVIVVDNGGYGAIRSQGARTLPGADVAAELRNPEWESWAHSMGMPAAVPSDNASANSAISQALGDRCGRMVVLRVSPVAAHANFDLPGRSANELEGVK